MALSEFATGPSKGANTTKYRCSAAHDLGAVWALVGLAVRQRVGGVWVVDVILPAQDAPLTGVSGLWGPAAQVDRPADAAAEWLWLWQDTVGC